MSVAGYVRERPSARERMTTLLDLFSELRLEVRAADSRDELLELHRRADYLVRLARAISVRSMDAGDLPGVAVREFSRTTDSLNRRGRELGLVTDFTPLWAA